MENTSKQELTNTDSNNEQKSENIKEINNEETKIATKDSRFKTKVIKSFI